MEGKDATSDVNQQFQSFSKIPRLSRECVITEKIDGTNAQILIPENGGKMLVGSRSRWITPEDDNYGFARWAYEHEEELRAGLGFGRHFGEWWGAGIQRRYDMKEKAFSLFNVNRWDAENLPTCCRVVPLLYKGPFDTEAIDDTLDMLRKLGSVAAPGFMRPEGIVVYHVAGGYLFKKTIEKDGEPKGKQE